MARGFARQSLAQPATARLLRPAASRVRAIVDFYDPLQRAFTNPAGAWSRPRHRFPWPVAEAQRRPVPHAGRRCRIDEKVVAYARGYCAGLFRPRPSFAGRNYRGGMPMRLSPAALLWSSARTIRPGEGRPGQGHQARPRQWQLGTLRQRWPRWLGWLWRRHRQGQLGDHRRRAECRCGARLRWTSSARAARPGGR